VLLRDALAREHGMLVAVLLVLVGGFLFAEIADDVLEGETRAVDEYVLLLFRSAHDPTDPLGPHWLEETARDVTGLGGIGILAFVALASAGFLVLQGKANLARYLLAAVGSGMVLSMLLKLGFDRPRPDLVPHGQIVYTSSFPSGHSMMSAITYLTLGALLASAQTSMLLRAYLLGVAMLLTVAVGISRVYLGVHWPTDVVGGWIAGGAWALACYYLARYLRRRGKVE